MDGPPPGIDLVVVAPGAIISKDGLVKSTVDGKLGMLYIRVLQILQDRQWVHKKSPGLRWNLFLSEAQGQSLPWKKMNAIAGDWKERNSLPPLVNFSRGFAVICRKSRLVSTMRSHAEACPSARVHDWFPASFNFYPAKPDQSEEREFLMAFELRKESAGRNAWILKPSDGGKGEGIVIMAGDSDAIIAFLRAQREGSIAWVVSEYIERPLLLPGARKFDWR